MRFSALPFDQYGYGFPDDSYYGGFTEFVLDSMLNSLAFGRNRLGTIHVFSTGAGSQFPLPPAYGGGGWAQLLEGNVIGVTATNGYIVGPNMYGAMPHYYPPAAHRDTLVFNTVAEDGLADVLGVLGPSVFASVYGATSQTTLIGAPSRLTQSTLPNDAFGEAEEDPSLLQLGANNATGGAIATGIIALMLEVNPNLKIRDIQHILVRAASTALLDFDPSQEYFRFSRLGAYLVGLAVPSHWETNAAFIRHSDQFGFGTIDAEIAVNLARTWTNVPRAIALDTGLVALEEALAIPDAEYVEVSETESRAVQDNPPTIIPLCIRDNLTIESVEVELSISGEGSNDLLIWIESPSGTVSNLHYPTSYSPSGMTDPENPEFVFADAGFAGVNINGDDFAFYKHQFVSYKHWGEPSGGRWQMFIIDLGPDGDLTEGTEEADPEPAIDHVTSFPPLFVPGNPAREEKTVVEYRVRIFGTDTGAAPFLGCAPTETSCPGDVNANGVVNGEDLAIFIGWYIEGNLLADITGDGVITFADMLAFRALWRPGFCAPSGLPFGRPTGASDTPNSPIVRPV
jgi:subtilisin-like proprotein convertase family protein